MLQIHRGGLLLRAGTCGFPLATMGMTSRSFHRKQKKNGTTEKTSLVLKVREIKMIVFAFAPLPLPPFFSLKFHIWECPPLDQKQVVLKGGGSKLL